MNALNVDINGKPSVISLFAGCGGSSLGYKLAGYNELLAIDFDKNAVETFKLNFKVPIWQRDIFKIKGQEILDFCKIEKGELDVLDGSPPCQGFSTAGKRKVCDLRNDLVNEYIRLVSEIEPKVFIMENVSGMVKGRMKGLFIEYLKKMKELNYNIKVKLLNAKYYNVPQSRQRLIFIGIRKDLNKELVFPIPNKTLITVREAFKDINSKTFLKTSIKEQKIIDNMKPGESGGITFKRIYKTKKVRWFNSLKILYNKPCPTILNKSISMIVHPSEKRLLSIEELKRVMTFPDSFKFIYTPKEQWQLIGNSVPPLFMKAIAETIRKEILEKTA